jgi:hypothetical protein
VLHRILDQRLEQQRRHARLGAVALERHVQAQPLGEARALDLQVEALQLHLFGQRQILHRIDRKAAPEEVGELNHHILRPVRRVADQSGNGVQGVEQEVRVDLVPQRADLRLLRLDHQFGGVPLLLLYRDAVGEREIGRGPGEIEPEPVKRQIDETRHAVQLVAEHDGVERPLDDGGSEGERCADDRLAPEFPQPQRPQAAIEDVAQEGAEKCEGYTTHAAFKEVLFAPRVDHVGAQPHDGEVGRPEDGNQYACPSPQAGMTGGSGMMRRAVQRAPVRKNWIVGDCASAA